MVYCPECNSRKIRIIDKGLTKIVRYFQGNNRYACKECNRTWREKSQELTNKIKRKRNT